MCLQLVFPLTDSRVIEHVLLILKQPDGGHGVASGSGAIHPFVLCQQKMVPLTMGLRAF